MMSYYNNWCDDGFAGTYAHDEAGYSDVPFDVSKTSKYSRIR